MKTPFLNRVGFSFLLCLAVWATRPLSIGQGGADLDIGVYAGLTITGTVGTVYQIQYVTDLAQTNRAANWRCLEFLQLPASPYLWTDKSTPATGRRFYRAVEFGAPTNMVFIPPGTFRMGSPTNETDRFDNESPQTIVTVSRGFWMGQHEVTQGEYLALTGTNPSYFTTNNGYAEDLNRPVEQLTWSAATNYCGQLTDQERAAGRIAVNSTYRLPTEAEWEYACRGWTSTRFSYGDDPGYTNLVNYAWYGDHGGTTHPVAQKLPNPWGLFDMSGNVSEWCQDWFDAYPGGILIDPQGPATGTGRVVRGGYYESPPEACRSAARGVNSPTYAYRSFGFRILLDPGQP
jgi:formylglycine-generating enzyme required for sulfatase activity